MTLISKYKKETKKLIKEIEENHEISYEEAYTKYTNNKLFDEEIIKQDMAIIDTQEEFIEDLEKLLK